jgi:hypothetical protein
MLNDAGSWNSQLITKERAGEGIGVWTLEIYANHATRGTDPDKLEYRGVAGRR